MGDAFIIVNIFEPGLEYETFNNDPEGKVTLDGVVYIKIGEVE
jgi:hypothetical protein